MNGRENILKRVRMVLVTAAPKLYERDGVKPSAPWYSPVGDGFEAMCNRFTEEFAALKGELFVAANASEASDRIRELIAKYGFKAVAAQDAEDLRGVTSGIAVQWLGTETGGGHALKDFDLGITGCDALVAMTGSVVLTAKSAGGRVMSALPHNHLVVAWREQLLPDIATALRLVKEKHGGRMPSFVNVTTGASRTSDIEKVLVMGAHGPKRLFVVLVGQ